MCKFITNKVSDKLAYQMLQYGYWPDGEVETLESAKLLCAGSIPAPASINLNLKKHPII